jgi:hypothetical protein
MNADIVTHEIVRPVFLQYWYTINTIFYYLFYLQQKRAFSTNNAAACGVSKELSENKIKIIAILVASYP